MFSLIVWLVRWLTLIATVINKVLGLVRFCIGIRTKLT